MRVLISADGEHYPDLHRMVVDNFGLLLNLDNLRKSAIDPASLTDPTIARVEWGPVVENGEAREGGCIVRQDGKVQRFWDLHVLEPYLAAFRQRKAEIEEEQRDHDARAAQARALQAAIARAEAQRPTAEAADVTP